MRGVADVEDHRAQVPVGQVRARRARVRDHRMHEVAAVFARRGVQRRAEVELAARAPASDLERRSWIRDVEDVEPERLGLDRELGRRLRRVDPGVPARGREPDLVRAPRKGPDEREPLRVRRPRDVVQAEAAEAGSAGLSAGHREHALEAGCVDTADDRLFRPGVAEADLDASAREGRDVPWLAWVGEVVDADAQRRAVAALSLPAGEVGVVALAEDVGAVAPAGVGMAEHVEARCLGGGGACAPV